MTKNVQTTVQLCLFTCSIVKLKMLQARLQRDVTQELPDAQAVFRKGRGTKNQNANIGWIIE